MVQPRTNCSLVLHRIARFSPDARTWLHVLWSTGLSWMEGFMGLAGVGCAVERWRSVWGGKGPNLGRMSDLSREETSTS